MRRKVGQIICDLAKKDKNIVLLVRYWLEFLINLEKNINRFFNLGICEQSLIGTASGMSLED